MKLWGYYAWHTFKNSIKKMFRSTVAAVFVAIIVIGATFGVAFSIIDMVFPDDSGTEYIEESSQYEGSYVGDEEDGEATNDEDYDEEEMTEEDIIFVKKLIESGVFLLIIIALLWGIYGGSQKGSDFFQMADVNLLFTAPMKPQSVLFFRLTFQMAALMLGSLYILFQIPNLVLNLGLGFYGVVAIIIGWMFLLLLKQLMSVLSYTITATHEKLKRYIIPFMILVGIIVAGVAGIGYLAFDRSITAVMDNIFAAEWSRWIPIVGWYKGMIMCAVNGEIVNSLIYMAFLIAGMAVMFYLIWQIKADFYEDAMSGAEKRETILQDAKEGRQTAVEKKRSAKLKKNTGMKGQGAEMFFTKELYIRHRTAKLGQITTTMFWYFAIGLLMSYVTVKVFELDTFTGAGCVIAFVLFFRTYGNPIAQETSINWLFLVPESPYKKIFYAMMAGTYASAIDLLPGLLVGMVLTGENPLIMLLWYITLLTMDFMLSAVGLMLEALFPATAMDMVKSMIQFVLKFMMILVIVIFFVVGMIFGGVVGGLVINLIANLLISAAVFVIYPSILHRGIS